MDKLYELEDSIESLELEIQKALSMVSLGINPLEAFQQTMKKTDEMLTLLISINDSDVKIIAMTKVQQALSELNAKLEQIN